MEKYIQRAFQLDLRSLGLLRMATSLVLLFDLGIRLSDYTLFYTDAGVLPADALRTFFGIHYPFSFHAWGGSTWLITLFCIQFASAILLLVGYQTRFNTVLSWLLLLSLQNRNPLILQGGDDLLRMVLLWNIFLPWGKRYSIDQYRRPDSGENQLYSLAGVGLIIQVCLVYFASALEKGPEWYADFTAMHYVYHLDQIDFPLATALAGQTTLLKVMTAFAWYFELLVAFLIIAPARSSAYRTLGVLLIVLFHLWNGISIQVGLFFMIGIASAIGLLPASFYLKAGARLDHLFNNLFSKTYAILFKSRSALSDETTPDQGITQYAMVILICYVLGWNLGNLPFVPYKMNEVLRTPGYWLRIEQDWGMFAPGVYKEDGWYVMQGITLNNDTIDITKQGAPVSFERPERLSSLYPNDRHRKFGEQYMMSWNTGIRKYYGRYLLKQWNLHNPQKKIRQLNIYFMLEFTLPDDRIPVPEKKLLVSVIEPSSVQHRNTK